MMEFTTSFDTLLLFGSNAPYIALTEISFKMLNDQAHTPSWYVVWCLHSYLQYLQYLTRSAGRDPQAQIPWHRYSIIVTSIMHIIIALIVLSTPNGHASILSHHHWWPLLVISITNILPLMTQSTSFLRLPPLQSRSPLPRSNSAQKSMSPLPNKMTRTKCISGSTTYLCCAQSWVCGNLWEKI